MRGEIKRLQGSALSIMNSLTSVKRTKQSFQMLNSLFRCFLFKSFHFSSDKRNQNTILPNRTLKKKHTYLAINSQEKSTNPSFFGDILGDTLITIPPKPSPLALLVEKNSCPGNHLPSKSNRAYHFGYSYFLHKKWHAPREMIFPNGMPFFINIAYTYESVLRFFSP